MAYPMNCDVKDGNTVALNGDLHISFRRTVRVPDNKKASFLPPDLGVFSLESVSQHADKLPGSMVAKGGLFFRMLQSEAMWINFECKRPYMIKVYAGGINVISGEPAVETTATRLRRIAKLAANKDTSEASPLQDYIIVPQQKLLDGIADSNGTVRQFVATHFGTGHSVEAQMAGADSAGGLQFEITAYWCPSRPGLNTFPIFYKNLTGKSRMIHVTSDTTIAELRWEIWGREGIPAEHQRIIFDGKQLGTTGYGDGPLEDEQPIKAYGISQDATLHLVLRLRGGRNVPANPEMNIAVGGQIKQVIHKDPHPKSWVGASTMVFNVQILNSCVYESVTGAQPQNRPMGVEQYSVQGLPFFSMCEEPSGISGSTNFACVKSVLQLEKFEDKEIRPAVISLTSSKAPIPAVGLTNPNGSLREFRTVADLEKQFEDYNIAKADLVIKHPGYNFAADLEKQFASYNTAMADLKKHFVRYNIYKF